MLRVQACVEHRYAVIFEKEARGCYHVFLPELAGAPYAERDDRRGRRENLRSDLPTWNV